MMYKSKSILVTGHTGFLGTILAKELRKSYIVQKFLSKEGKRIDITKPFNLHNSVDIILHAAGKAHSVPKSKEEEKEFYDVNYNGTVHLCAALEKLETLPKAFIFISSVAVYGEASGELIDETHPLNGTTPYAKAKIQSEAYLQKWAEKTGITLSILRLPLAAGPNAPGNLGAMINGIKTGKYLSLGKAQARKSMIWAADIADIVPKLEEQGGIYNLTDRHHPSFNELETLISRVLKKSAPKKVPVWFAKLLGVAGNLLGPNAVINTKKVNKILLTLTFDDKKAVKELAWKPTSVLSKLPIIVESKNNKQHQSKRKSTLS